MCAVGRPFKSRVAIDACISRVTNFGQKDTRERKEGIWKRTGELGAPAALGVRVEFRLLHDFAALLARERDLRVVGTG
jgi:hypothetical protein